MKQNLIDVAEFTVIGGKGGNGAISWRREKYIPKGGPDGGDGGKGGSIILKVNSQLSTLRFFAGKDRFLGAMGHPGSKRGSDGEDAIDTIIEVPAGTVVKVGTFDYRLPEGREFYGEGFEEVMYSGYKVDNVPFVNLEERWSIPSSSDLPSHVLDLPATSWRGPAARVRLANPADAVDKEWLEVGDLNEEGEELIIARGGRGGKGNKHYKSSTMTTPKFALKGELGERYRVRLELKVLADVGLVGLPNVGKSTLLSVLTAARPEIANYPFTTLSPNLGVMSLSGSRSLVLADIPGLIEDAHKGKGLGIDFLKHVERCKVLVYVLAAEDYSETGIQSIGKLLWEQYQVVKKEVESYSQTLLEKKSMVVVNKIDLISDSRSKIYDLFKEKGVELIMVSGATHEGADELKEQIQKLIR